MKNKEQNKGKNGGSAGKSVTRTISANKFPFVIVPVVLVCIGILYSMLKTMTVDREHWVQIRKDNFEKDSVELKPNRGNILSAEGELLSSSLPNYKVRFDFLAGIPNMPKDTMNRKDYDKAVAVRDSLIRMKDSTEGLYVGCQFACHQWRFGKNLSCPRFCRLLQPHQAWHGKACSLF